MADFIIFGEGNYNSLGVLHCMACAGVPVFILNIGDGKDIAGGNIILYSKFAEQSHCVNSEVEGLKWLLANMQKFPKRTVIYPTSDAVEKLLDTHMDVLSEHYIFPNAGNEGSVSRLMDKHLQTELAKDAGVRILESQYTNDVGFSFDKVKYPCMVKPLNSTAGSKGDMRVCDDEKELRDALASGKHTRDFIVQQYIHNEADLLFLGVANKNGEVWIPAVVVKPGVSPTGEYTHAVVSTDIHKYMEQYDAVVDFVRSLKYVGPFSIEFGLEQGKNYFFEINLRNDGTSHYPLAAGVNIAAEYYQAVKDDAYNSPELTSSVEYDMIDEVGDFRGVLLHEVSLGNRLRICRNAGSYSFYCHKDKILLFPLMGMVLNRVWIKIMSKNCGGKKMIKMMLPLTCIRLDFCDVKLGSNPIAA